MTETVTIEKQVWESTLNRSMVLEAENAKLKEQLKDCLEVLEMVASETIDFPRTVDESIEKIQMKKDLFVQAIKDAKATSTMYWLKDMTVEQFKKFKCKCLCKDCIFNNVYCVSSRSCWVRHKDLYSDEFLNQEIEIDCEILTEEEKGYLNLVFKPYNKNIRYIVKKLYCNDKEYIIVCLEENQIMAFPYFEKGKMYKGMELYKEYTPKDLGLWENRGDKGK